MSVVVLSPLVLERIFADKWHRFFYRLDALPVTQSTRSRPEMVSDMLHVTLNSDLSKIPFMCF